MKSGNRILDMLLFLNERSVEKSEGKKLSRMKRLVKVIKVCHKKYQEFVAMKENILTPRNP